MIEFQLELVKRSNPEYQEIRNNHYIENHGCIGRQLHYLILSEGIPIGIISGASPVWATRSRDEYFGITKENRIEMVGKYIINNVVFRLEKTEYNLGSRVLSRWRKRVARDWLERYGNAPIGFETFIYGENRSGAVYKADNWDYAGCTSGNTKFKPHGAYGVTERRETEQKLVFCRYI